jgi:hypothetical protein
MKISLESLARFYAASRNFASMAVGFGASLGLISVVQQKTLSDGFADIFAGIAQMAHGAASVWQVLVIIGGPAIGGISMWYAQRSAKKTSNVAALAAAPETVVTPGPNGTATMSLPPALAGPALAGQKSAS